MLLINEFAAKSTLNQLECLLEDVSFAIQTANKCLSSLWDKDFSNALDQQATYDKVVFVFFVAYNVYSLS